MDFVRSFISAAVSGEQPGQYDPKAPLNGVVFVVNPTSAAGKAEGFWKRFEEALVKAATDKGMLTGGEKLTVEKTVGPKDAVQKTRRALEGGARGIVAVGGDGTLSECVQGFFKEGENAFPGAVLGFVPCGTGGDFRRTLKWGKGVDEGVQRLLAPNPVPIDVGHVRMREQGGWVEASGDAYFVNVSSVGSSALVAKISNETPKLLGGAVTFWGATARALLQYHPQAVRFRRDGGEWEEAASVNCLAVCNGKYFGGGMKVAPGAEIDDGLFDVTIWAGFGVLDFVTQSGQLYSGKHVNNAKTRTFRCSTLEVAPPPKGALPVELDGEDAAGRAPDTWRVVRGGVRLLS